MTTITHNPVENMVQSMRQIRDEISHEIQDMTFAEERAYLDKVLNIKSPKKISATKGDKKVRPVKSGL